MADRDRIRNMSQSADVRTFTLSFQIQFPTIGIPLYLDPDAVFPYEIISIRILLEDGIVELVPEIDGDILLTDCSDSYGRIPVDQPVVQVCEPISPSAAIVPLGGSLLVTIDDATTDATNLVVNVVCRRTDVNVP